MQQLINGISLGGLYALAAIGYSMVYGVLELINFTHGSVYMVGAFLFYIFVSLLGMPTLIAFLLAILAGGLLGVLIEKLFFRPLRVCKQPKIYSMICSIGVSIILQNIMFLTMGSETRKYPTIFSDQYISIFGINVLYVQVIIILISAVLLIGLSLFVKKHKMGMAMRATAQNYDASELMGISVDRVISSTFFLGSALAVLSGILACTIFGSVDISIGVSIGTKMFAATILGGIGNLLGAVLGGFVIAIAEIFTAGYLSSNWRDMAAFVVLIMILIIRPSGILGKPIQKKV